MRVFQRHSAILFAAVSLLTCAGTAAAEPPHIGYVYPDGGALGTELEVKVGGQFIYGAAKAVVIGAGVAAQITDASEPAKRKPNNQKKAIDEVITLKITIAPDAVPGNRELCLITAAGISNKLTFNISRLREIAETEPNNQPVNATRIPALPVVINGQIMPGDVDIFKFSAKKGQLLVFEAFARALTPYLADAVPGWFKMALTLYDVRGRELAFADDFRYEQDPALFYRVEADGDYLLAVRDAIYRGREDFVYRIRAGEIPYLTHLFPLGAAAGKSPATVRVFGVNLPAEQLQVKVEQTPPSVLEIGVSNNGVDSNRRRFAVGGLPEILAAPACLAGAAPQKIIMPVIINGCIQRPGEKNYFCFDGIKGQVVSAEVVARRLGSPLDSVIALFDRNGKLLQENDDLKDLREGHLTHHADAALVCSLPETGTYKLQLGDQQGKGGQDYAYRLRVSAPVPDFALLITPASCTLPRGGAAMLTAHVIRRDGFNGPIRLALKGNPAGLVLNGGFIPAGSSRARITIAASETAKPELVHPELEGAALIQGAEVRRPALPADDATQAFSLHHLVAFAETTALINDAPFTVSISSRGILELTPGRDVALPLEIKRNSGMNAPISIQLLEPPKGIFLKNGFIPAGKNKHVITIRTAAGVPPGLENNLILNGIAYLDQTEPDIPAKPSLDPLSLPFLNPLLPPSLSLLFPPESRSKDTAGDNKIALNGVLTKKIKREKVVIMLPAAPFKVVKPVAGQK